MIPYLYNMRTTFVKILIILLLVGNSLHGKSQGIAINTVGNTNRVGAILDLSNNNTVGAVGFLPPYVSLTSSTVLTTPITLGVAANLKGLMVYNTNTSTASGLTGPGLYFWDNAATKWNY